MRLTFRTLSGLALCAGLVACSEPPPPPPAGPTINSAAANESVLLFDQAMAEGRGQLARAYAEDILAKYPGTEAAAKVQAAMAEVEVMAAADRERTRLANMWVYHAVGEVKGTTYTAFMYEADSKELAREERPQLVLRRHPEWGQNVYILLPGGRIACGARCNINLKIDDANPARFEASQPEGAPVPAMFIEEHRRFFEALKTAQWIEIEVPIRGGKRPLRFEVGGIDLARMEPAVQSPG
jgi:hypothetical protein